MTEKYTMISKYAGLGSYEINPVIREYKDYDLIPQKIQDKIKLLERELGLLDSTNEELVYRNDHISEWTEYSIFYNYFKGKVIKRPEFLSVFQKRPKDKSLFHLVIKVSKNSNCRNIIPALMSSKHDKDKIKADVENEGIFVRGTNFKILEVDDKNELIYLEETMEKSIFTFTRNSMINHPCLKDVIKIRTYPESLSEKGLI